jgi:heat shock protein HslJ
MESKSTFTDMDGGRMKSSRIWTSAAVLAAGIALAGCAGQPGSEADVSTVVGTWQSSEENAPHLTFTEDGKYAGNDGCNALSGRYTQEGDTVTVTMSISTLKGCPGVDTWLSQASEITVGDTQLEVFDDSGELIGALARQG